MVKPTSPATKIGGHDKEDLVQNETLVETREEEQMDREDYVDKVGSTPHENVEGTSDSPQRETMLSFLHSTKLKYDSILHVD